MNEMFFQKQNYGGFADRHSKNVFKKPKKVFKVLLYPEIYTKKHPLDDLDVFDGSKEALD